MSSSRSARPRPAAALDAFKYLIDINAPKRQDWAAIGEILRPQLLSVRCHVDPFREAVLYAGLRTYNALLELGFVQHRLQEIPETFGGPADLGELVRTLVL